MRNSMHLTCKTCPCEYHEIANMLSEHKMKGHASYLGYIINCNPQFLSARPELQIQEVFPK